MIPLFANMRHFDVVPTAFNVGFKAMKEDESADCRTFTGE